MRKVDRLFEIVQLLRGQRLRTADFLARQLGVSVRTIYRDIKGLMASGVPIEGEAGIGYVIRQSIEMPPLKFTPLELKSIQLGIDMVLASADEEVAKAAQEASIKIMDALSKPVSDQDAPIAHVYFESDQQSRENLNIIRHALEDKYEIKFSYSDGQNKKTTRVVQPLGLEYWGKDWTLTAWCKLREDFRVFRLDRITDCTETGETFISQKGRTYQDYLHQISNDD